MPQARPCYECTIRLAAVRLTLQPKYDSPEQQWVCADCSCDALQDWLFGLQWLDIEAVTLVRL